MFSHALKIETSTTLNFALSLFIGLVFFNLFAELAMRAPLLLSEHANFIKKSIFPSEVLAWTSMLRALVYAGIAFVIFLGFELYIMGRIPLAILLFPFIVLPFCLFLLGTVWFLAAIGAFTRDISFMMATIIPVFMFASPVFYTTLGFSFSSRMLAYIIPVSPYMEMAREILLIGRAPDLLSYGIAWGTALFIFYGGYAFFMRFRSVVVDVI
jgi:lipopolysaccharide transport system permease protein